MYYCTSTTSSTIVITIEAPATMDISTADILVISIVFSDTDIDDTTQTCSVIQPSIGASSCTWSDGSVRTLVFTGI
jgi:hypothetical protein